MEKASIIEKLEDFKNDLNHWNNVQMTDEESTALRTQINKKKPFVEQIINNVGTAKRFDWTPPPAVGGFVLKGVNPFESIFNPPYRTNVIQMITDSIDEAIGIIENLDTFIFFDEQSTQKKTKSQKKNNSKKIFIVHGHDNELKETVARFLEKIELEPIILHEQVNGGLTIIEKFEKNADVQFAIILMTPDDLGNSKANFEKLNLRARQNVILELGYFLGKLGRENVCALIKGDIERPSDYDGVIYISVDETEGWKLLLAKELKQAKLVFDGNKIF